MATITPKTLVQGVLLAASAPATPGLYAVPALKSATIRHMRMVNTDVSARTVTIHLVASGGTAEAKNKVLGPVSLDPDEALIDDSIIVLEAWCPMKMSRSSYFISAFASIANVISFRADGAEVTP